MRLVQFILISISVLLLLQGCGDSSGSVDEPPEIITDGRFSAFTEEPFSLNIQTDDPQGLDVSVFAESLPEWLEFIPQEARLSGTPSPENRGLFSIEISASNGTFDISKLVQIQVYSGQKEVEFQSALDDAIRRQTQSLQGVAATVIDAEGTTFNAYFGTHGVGFTTQAVDQTNLFRIASVTKPMTTAIILKLVDKGMLGLDDLLSDHLEVGLPNETRITIRQILSHTAGVFDHLNANSFWSSPSFSPTKVWSVDEIVAFARNHGPLFSPGTAYAYSNTSFYVLGALIEEVTGLELKDAYQTYIFEPLGLRNILYDNFSTSSNPIPALALNSRSYEYHLTTVSSAGAIAAHPEDVAHFGRALYGGRFVSDELTSKLNINIGAELNGQNYGLGTRIWDIGGIPHHGHTGALMDYRNILMYIPKADLTIAIHTHDVHAGWFALVDEIFEYAVQAFSPQPAKLTPFIYGLEPRE
ncbi:MAG: hypothetical protein EA391_09155 [Balneolaceae bacterium]|nr:MAG: hypothetical protein EA391_09155 [Balneolaceae bacterium]